MKTSDYILAALSCLPAYTTLTASQIQKFFFLLDFNLPKMCDLGPFFDYTPGDYGPYSKKLFKKYNELVELDYCRVVEVVGSGGKLYMLSAQGYKHSMNLNACLSPEVYVYISDVGKFVIGLSFTELVSSINKAYPEMALKTVFSS